MLLCRKMSVVQGVTHKTMMCGMSAGEKRVTAVHNQIFKYCYKSSFSCVAVEPHFL